jgi:hypothetical protein
MVSGVSLGTTGVPAMFKSTIKTQNLQARIERRTGVSLTFAQAHALRRAELTLQRWAELECGDSNDYASRGLERDEATGRPYMVVIPHKGDGKARRYPVADRERGALKRVASVCKDAGLNFYHQCDPRGCALYVGSVALTDNNYSGTGVACCD